MFISIIIPVYNVEKYIGHCVNSILGQDYDDYELILVDDGSEDGSGKICDAYAQKHPQLSVLHKANGGPSDARNAGLRAAKGEYVLFVDSDDFIGQGSLRQLAECALKQAKPDVVFLEAFKIFPDRTVISLGDGYDPEHILGKSKEEVLKHLAELPKYPGSACTKLVKRSLVFGHDLFFEDLWLAEDIDWTLRVAMKAHSFGYCPAKYYYYRQNRAHSGTATVDVKKVKNLLYVIGKWSFPGSGIQNQKEINTFMAYEYMIALYYYGNLTRPDRHRVKGILKKYMWVMRYAGSKRTRITAIACRLCGIGLTSKALNIGNGVIRDLRNIRAGTWNRKGQDSW